MNVQSKVSVPAVRERLVGLSLGAYISADNLFVQNILLVRDIYRCVFSSVVGRYC